MKLRRSFVFRSIILTLLCLLLVMGAQFNNNMNYGLTLDVPKEFYHESHRTAHFMNFSTMEDSNIEADLEDAFA